MTRFLVTVTVAAAAMFGCASEGDDQRRVPALNPPRASTPESPPASSTALPPSPAPAIEPPALGPAPASEDSVPPENAADLAEPPPRPGADGAQIMAADLLRAIAEDNPALAADFFFPKAAFRLVKNIPDPDRYWQRLFARYEADIHALHAATPELARAQFERLEVVKRGGWVAVGDEGNKLPYWAARHNRLHYTVDGAARSLEVRVLITWGNNWYITHLSEFH